jgi:hypothetical protein
MGEAGTRSGRTVREAVGVLKERENWRADIATAVSSLSKMGRWRGGKAGVTEGVLKARAR